MASSIEWVLLGITIISWLCLAFWLLHLRRRRNESGYAASLLDRILLGTSLILGMTSAVALLLSKEGVPGDEIVTVIALMDSSFEHSLIRYGLAVVYLFVLLLIVVPIMRRTGRN